MYMYCINREPETKTANEKVESNLDLELFRNRFIGCGTKNVNEKEEPESKP